MQELMKAVEMIGQQKPDWQEWYISNGYLNASYEDETRKLLEEIIQIVYAKEKQLMDDPDSKEAQEWPEKAGTLISKEAFQKIQWDIKDVLDIYSKMKIIRDLGKNITAFLSDAFDHFCTPYRSDFSEEEIDQFQISDTARFKRAVRALYAVIRTHVRERFSKQTAKEEFERVTGIMDPFSSYYADLYIRHFDILQRKIFCDQLEQIQDKLDYMISILDNDPSRSFPQC